MHVSTIIPLLFPCRSARPCNQAKGCHYERSRASSLQLLVLWTVKYCVSRYPRARPEATASGNRLNVKKLFCKNPKAALQLTSMFQLFQLTTKLDEGECSSFALVICQAPSGHVAPAPVLHDRDCTYLLSLLLRAPLPFPVGTEIENGYPAPPATWQPPLGTSSKTWHNICKRGTPEERARAASGTPRDCLYHHSVLTRMYA
jgi:hypothetical protein